MAPLSSLSVNAGLRIAATPPTVYEAIVDPQKMSHYFIAHGSDRLEAGKTVEWRFPEMDASFPIEVVNTIPAQEVQWRWQLPDGTTTTVTITLKKIEEKITFVQVTEGEKEVDEKGIAWLKSNTEGWANFLACLKAYIEFGINLRKGAFDPSQMPE